MNIFATHTQINLEKQWIFKEKRYDLASNLNRPDRVGQSRPTN
jgi:hypothetical protein